MIFNTNYNRQDFLRVLQTKICPDFVTNIRPLECSRQTKFVVDGIHQLGTIKFADNEVLVLEIKQLSDKDPRITLTKDAFKLLHDHQKDNALVIFRSESKTWRLSLLTSKYEWWDKVNSNPKRYSFLLGEWEKTKTPEKYLIEKWVVKSFEELVNRFDVEVVRKEFFKLYMNLFLELYGEIQNNGTFSVLMKYNKIEPVAFAKNLMGKMIFLYFIQKKWWLGIADKNKPFWEWDRDFFKNNFEKLAHNADLFQKSMNFYNDFLEPLFYSGLNKKNHEDRHPTLNMKVPYLNWGLFQEEYDRNNTIINLDNEIFKNIIRSFDTYNFTIDEDDAHDREIAVDPEMLGKIFESMISVSKDNIDQIMEVYREAKNKKKITHPNPETILNIDIWKEINKKFWAFYTPREIVHYMTKESLIAHLVTRIHEKNANQSEEEVEKIIRKLFEYKDKHLTKQEIESEKADGYELLKRYVFDIQESLKSLKILDPAVWSGAFPMGILQEILWLRRYLVDTFDLKSESDFEIKKQIVQNSIYGVDIDPGAIDIARLRFRLSLIVDATAPVPLPNLDFKFVCANSLIPLEGGSLFTKQDVIDEVARLRLEYFVCSDLDQKETLKKTFNALQVELSGFWTKNKNEFKTPKEWRKYIEELVKQNTDSRNRQIMERDPFDTSISNGWFDSQMMFGIEWFDIVIGNPPYVRQEEFKEEKEILKRIYWNFFNWRADLYTFFIKLAFNLTKKDWVCSYITSNKFLVRWYWQNTRSLLTKDIVLKKMINFWELPVFEAAVDSIVLLWLNKTPSDNDMVEYVQAKNASDIYNISTFFELNKEKIEIKNLWIDEWVLQDSIKLKVLNKLKEHKKTLWTYYTQDIFAWIKSWCDSAFVISKAEKDNLMKEDIKSEDLIKPRFRGKDIRKWNADFKDLYVIYIPLNKVDIDKYPAIKNHLLKFRSQLEKRATQQQRFEMQQPQERFTNLFKIPKIIYWEISTEMRACVDLNQSYWTMKMFFIPYDALILAILNSKLFDWYARMTFATLWDPWNGWRISFNTMYMAKVPIPEWNKELILQIEILVNKILDKKKEYSQSNISDLEEKIDEIVYELYGLTKEEIDIVEGSVGKEKL